MYTLTMKFTVLRSDISKALNIASYFVSARAQVPVLGAIVLKAHKASLSLFATNLETAFSTSIGAKIDEEGEIGVPAKVISEVLANIAGETITFESSKEHLIISTENFSGKILGMNTSDFPSLVTKISEQSFELAPAFLEALPSLLFSVSRDESRPVLSGILLSFHEGLLTLVATDGFRLSQKKINLSVPPQFEKIIIPKSVIQTIMRIIPENTSLMCSVDTSGNQLMVGFDNTVITSRLIEGTYPPYEKIIPGSSRIKISVSKEDFLQAIKLAGVFARESSNHIELGISKGSFFIQAKSSKSGEQKTVVPAKVQGEDVSITFNYKFIEEFLQAVGGGEVDIELIDATTAAIFRDSAEKNYLHLIMPVKV